MKTLSIIIDGVEHEYVKSMGALCENCSLDDMCCMDECICRVLGISHEDIPGYFQIKETTNN